MDNRLKLIKDMVEPCDTAADIGTDHGFLICALVAEGRARRGIAADINPLPLESARQEIARQGLSGKITTVLTDGLEGITLGRGDAVVIAGMGGELIARIVEDWAQHKNTQIDYYLQPMTKPERLRKYLYGSGFNILSERCCIAAGRPYSVMHVRYDGKARALTPWQLYLGWIDPLAGEAEVAYCRKLRAKLSTIVHGIADSGGQSNELDLLRGLIAELERKTENAGI
ncbi:MAG: class I SAM-dependent methyltransferase [Angelakisella sp.]